MPHEVIMPALGMAQDTGLIVSWLKKSGDVIKAGDALMEVETDKAVMEVEALADGVLTDIRAVAGDAVPVGSVIAVIASAEGETLQVGSRPALAPDLPVLDASGPDATAAVPVSKPAGQSIIMPALGMAQETGRLISWLKSPGDAVTADEILLEVETDKSTMEVPAGHDGYVAALLAEAGQEIPVGDVIAVTRRPSQRMPRNNALSCALLRQAHRQRLLRQVYLRRCPLPRPPGRCPLLRPMAGYWRHQKPADWPWSRACTLVCWLKTDIHSPFTCPIWRCCAVFPQLLL
jgi:pyruvate/2-oxoglutarate dehydrogenase complex dihydrolipoamide acyltransferase (E2) component